MSNPFDPTSLPGFLVTFLHTRVPARRDERGASTVEWVVIAAVVLGIIAIVATVLRGALQGQANNIGEQIGNAGN